MRYELRAEVPGKFHALPVMAQALYVPELKGQLRPRSASKSPTGRKADTEPTRPDRGSREARSSPRLLVVPA